MTTRARAISAVGSVAVAASLVAVVASEHSGTTAASPRPAATVVEAIYPTAETVPANLLRMYVVFSRPMARGEAEDRIALFDELGRRVEGAFLPFEPELWDPSGRRLTLFFDPGRIKRGLRTHEELGAPLSAGRRFRLHVDARWPDATGRTLLDGCDRWLTVTNDDRTSPSAAAWRVTAPRAGTREPIVLDAREPLDRALAERMICVRGEDGAVWPTTVEMATGERAVRLVPKRRWSAGAYRLTIDAELEDLAGNSFRRLFDADLADPNQRPHDELREVEIPVRI